MISNIYVQRETLLQIENFPGRYIFPFFGKEKYDVFWKCWLIKFDPSIFFFERAENFTLKFDYFFNISFVESSNAYESTDSFQFYTLVYYNMNYIEQNNNRR